MNKAWGVLALAFVLLPPSFAPAFSEGLPLDDKARFERSLEEKVDSVLTHMLGPNQAKIVIDATIDFTRMESVEIRSSELNEEQKAQAGKFLWQSLQQEEFKKPQILPGFSVPEEMPKGKADAGTVSAGNQKYERQLLYPSAFLKKLVVTVVLNQSISEAKAENVREVVSNLLGIAAPRGDVLNLVRAQFPPPWKTVWYSQESATFVVKYAAVTLLSVMALVILGMSLMRLAGAMSAVASAQMHQVSLEMPKMGGLLPEGPKEGLGGEAAHAEGREAAGGDSLVFDVKPEQVDTLVEMIGGEDAPNIALVVSHLPPDSRKAFLSKLPSAVAAGVLDHLSSVKFVDPEMIANLKEELERRLRGALGGLPQVLALLEQVDSRTKMNLIGELNRTNPALAREVRRRTLLLDDLARLPEPEFGILALSVKTEDWALALHGAADTLRALVKAQLPPKSWQILEQTMAARRPTPEKAQQAQERVVALALKLIADGRISNPMATLPELLESASTPPAVSAVEPLSTGAAAPEAPPAAPGAQA